MGPSEAREQKGMERDLGIPLAQVGAIMPA
jgi:hypothetical protein